jgi:hypothetical protein
MHRMPGWDPASGLSLEDGRAGLIRFIRECRPQGKGPDTMTVVFDGREDVVGAHADPDIRVIFTRGTSADDRIRDLLEEAADPRRVICVSDDRELADACRHRGGVVWSVARFLGQGRRPAAPAKTRRGSAGGPLEAEEKAISPAAAGRIDRELSGLWLYSKKA